MKALSTINFAASVIIYALDAKIAALNIKTWLICPTSLFKGPIGPATVDSV